MSIIASCIQSAGLFCIYFPALPQERLSATIINNVVICVPWGCPDLLRYSGFGNGFCNTDYTPLGPPRDTNYLPELDSSEKGWIGIIVYSS
jgi:hypothetical protein